MNVPDELKYSKEHEWIRVEGESATIGITDYAQSELGDVVFVELPDVGATFAANEAFGSLESIKAVSEAYMPVAGEVAEVNKSLEESPEKINDDPYGDGWMIRIHLTNSSETNELMSSQEYSKYVGEESGE